LVEKSGRSLASGDTFAQGRRSSADWIMKNKRLKGIYQMTGSRYWWFRYQRNGKRYAVSLKTTNEGEAVTRAQAILADGLIAAEEYNPLQPPSENVKSTA